MKSYLSLIPISAKVRKRQNRMTLLCIIFAVFLVTSIFSMADMGFQMEQTRLFEKHENMTFQDIVNNPMAQTLFLTAAILFLLVLIAGVLMISSTLNTTVAQRTKFFGMMRCIGMSKEQIVRFVRLEALNWCKTAIPIGVTLGITLTWGLCAVLRLFVGGEFSNIPLFGISVIGIISGIVVGVITVLLAAGSPAKRAAKVSPVTAISGNLENSKQLRHAVNTRGFRIETALGIRHAVAAKKNLILITGSFALSIILFFSFLVLIDFVGCLVPQSSSTADISISSSDGTNSIDNELLDTINNMEGIMRAFGRRNKLGVPAIIGENNLSSTIIDIVSYDDFELECLSKDKILKKGSKITKVYGNSQYVLATWDKYSTLEIGDKIQVNNEELEIAGLLKYDPFSEDGLTNGRVTLITSGDTFARLTGISDYSLLMAQTANDISEDEIGAISNIVDEKYIFSDKRDERTTGIYTAFVFCVYGFLAIITLVAALNVINNISMSVSARIKQYGAMRAVGMDEQQVTKMIIAEAFTYATTGCIVGCMIGLFISKQLFNILIATHFSYAVWNVPVIPLLVILLFVFLTVIIAVYAPAKRIRNMEITEIINEL